MLAREDGRLDEAATLLNRALETRPGEVSALFQMAQLQRVKGLTSEAIALLEQIEKQVPDFLPTRILLAQLYFKTDRKQDAERERSEIQRLTEAQQKFSEELLKRDQAKPSAFRTDEFNCSIDYR
jgi:lipopolysaccharide biosynthesis regulator YciM